jgi:GNAT superfamily N-acetyltransferase
MATSPHDRQLRVLPATKDRWAEVVACFGRRGDDPAWCWCQRFVGPPADGDHRAALHRQIAAAAVPIGLVAFAGERPVGWTRVVPRSELPGVLSNRALVRLLPEDGGAWWVTCFAVDSRHRGSGVGSALLNAAVAHAREHGASAVEGHPVDVDMLTAAKVGGAALFTGTRAMFAAAGFTEIGRTFPSKPVMRLEFRPRR